MCIRPFFANPVTYTIFENLPADFRNSSYGNHALAARARNCYRYSLRCMLFVDIMSIRISGQVHMEKNYNISVRLGMCMTCMLFPLCDVRTSELAVDEDGIESDGVSFGLGKIDSTCWSALGSTRAFKIFQ